MTNQQMWFIAELVMEITVADDSRNVVHRNHVLISASSNEEAYLKAGDLGRRGETSYDNPAGKAVQIRFVGIADLDEILDPLEDGAEVLFRYTIDVPRNVLTTLIPDKQFLRAFAPRRKSEGPDYASAEVVNMVRTTTGFNRPA